MKKETLATLSLGLMALIWGNGFIVVQMALNCGWQPFPLIAVRGILGATALLGFSLKQKWWRNPKALFWGVLTGALYFAGYALQTVGQNLSSVTNSAFLTALYVIMVPLILHFCMKQTILRKVYAAALIAMLGTAFLSMDGGFSMQLGDILIILGALSFALQIIYTVQCVKYADAVSVVVIQLYTMGFLSLLSMPLSGQTSIPRVGWLYVVLLALISSALAQFLQTFAQKYVNPSTAGLILSQEGTVATIAAIIFLHEPCTLKVVSGCVLMLTAIIMVEWNGLPKRSKTIDETNPTRKEHVA